MTPSPDDLEAIVQREKSLERARRLASRSTTHAVQWRNRDVEPVAWQHDLGRLCDRLVDSALASKGVATREAPGLLVALSAPPRHGKTEWVGRAMPIRAFLAAAAAGVKFSVFYVSSVSSRVSEVSHRVRSAVERLYRETGDVAYKPGRIWTTTEWETEGGLAWTATGWRSATGGIGCDLLIMDDMIGSSKVYRSPADREKIRRVLEEDLLSRVEGGAALHMETRRGREDTTAWLLEEYGEKWEDHTWACYDEARVPTSNDASNREDEQARAGGHGLHPAGYLWPEKYGKAWHDEKPGLFTGSPVWRSLYQQEPVAEGGTLIQPEWLTATYPESPAAARVLADYVVLGADLTNTKKKKSDPAAFVVIGYRGAYRDVLDVVCRRCGYVEQKRILRGLAATWRPDEINIERAAGGDQAVDDLKGELAGIDGLFPVGDKVTRLLPHLGRFASGQVRTPGQGARWVSSWREEHIAFTGEDGEEDNQVDATVWALKRRAVSVENVEEAAEALRAVFGG